MSSRAPVARRSPRTTAQYRVYEGLIRAAGEMDRDFADLFKAHGLSQAQYNVLRILRGAGDAGLACGQVGDRLIRHDPDVTRLLDRLEKGGLIARVREPADRRIVRTRITAAGLALVARLDAPVDAIHERRFGHMSEARLKQLRGLIDEACGPGDT